MKLHRPSHRELRVRSREILAAEHVEGLDFDAATEVPMSLWQEVDETLAGGGKENFRNVVQLVLTDPERKEKLRESPRLGKKMLEALNKRLDTEPVDTRHIAWMHFFPYAQVFPELIQRMREVSLGEFSNEFNLRKLSTLEALKHPPDVNYTNSLLALYLVYPDHIQDMREWFEEIKLFAWLKQAITQNIQRGGWGRVIDVSAKAVLLFPERQEEIKNLITPAWGNMLAWLRAAVERQPSLAFAEYYYNLSVLAAGEVEWGMDGVVRTKEAKGSVGGHEVPLPDRPQV